MHIFHNFIQALHEALLLYKAEFTNSFILQKETIYHTHLSKLSSIDQLLTSTGKTIFKIENERQDFCNLIRQVNIDNERKHTQSSTTRSLSPGFDSHLTTRVNELHEYVKILIKKHKPKNQKLATVPE